MREIDDGADVVFDVFSLVHVINHCVGGVKARARRRRPVLPATRDRVYRARLEWQSQAAKCTGNQSM